MTTRELALKVKEMRDVQNEYFRTRIPGVLNRSKRLEREVDKAIAEILMPESQKQETLFG